MPVAFVCTDAAFLGAANYTSGFFGKYLNAYGEQPQDLPRAQRPSPSDAQEVLADALCGQTSRH